MPRRRTGRESRRRSKSFRRNAEKLFGFGKNFWSLLPSGCLIGVVFLGSSWVSGCIAKRPGIGAAVERSPELAKALYRSLQERGEYVKTLEGTAKCRLRTGEGKTRLDALLVAEKPSRVRIEVMDFLDHLLFMILVRDDYLSTYSVSDNLYSRGRASPERVQDFLGIPLRAEEFVSVVLGSAFFVPIVDPLLRLTSQEGQDVLTAFDPTGALRYEVSVDGDGRPREILLLESARQDEKAVGIRVTLWKYKKVDNFEFPFRIRVLHEGSGDSFLLEYQEVGLNRVLLKDAFEFEPPTDSARMNW
jgi:hypothetical protein